MANHRRIKIIVFFCAIPVCLFLATFPLLFTDKTSPPSDYHQNKFFAQTNQEVTVHFISGKEKGPTLLIFGGIHGDEAAGYLTAERYAQIKIKKGNLIVVPRLNASAISKRKRQGLGGDMNRLFDLSEKMSQRNPDVKVVDLAKSLIQRADYVINLHQAYDFYAPRWISRQRNPSKWGQSNVIDTPIYHLRNGEKLEPGRFAQKVSRRSNRRIMDRNFHFLVNNTNTSGDESRHKEQQGSLTYYALTKQHKISLAVEATKNCSLPEAIAFLTIAVNSALEEAGIQPDPPPSEDFLMISREMKGKRRGKIVSVSSLAASKAVTGMGIYGIAKAGIEMMTRVLAAELASFNIQVNAVAPGMVRTDFSKLFWSTPAILDQIVKTIPAGRIAEPADMVYPVLFLCSPYADYITG